MGSDNSSINDAVKRLVSEFEPERIILFGSNAWGTPRSDSDVDLMVIIRSSDEQPTARAARAYRCLRGLSRSFEILVNTQSEIERYASVPASLSRKILTSGKILYGRPQV